MEQYKINLLKLVAKHDLQYDLDWNEDLIFHIGCNDLFFWGCADAESIESQEDVDLYEQSIEDVRAFDNWACYLYCARKRKMRPQGAAYPDEKSLWPLFDACGPEREINMGNPKPRPTE